MSKGKNTRLGGILAAAFAVACVAAPARACIIDVGINDSTPGVGFVFPNWSKTLMAIFDTEWGDGVTNCVGELDASFVAITIANYGTATGGAGGDITGMYVCFDCGTSGPGCAPGSIDSATMTYAGVWNMAGTNRDIWTWSGYLPLDADPCASCGCIEIMSVFVDIGPCPTEGRTIMLGPGFDDIKDPVSPGGFIDEFGWDAPYIAVYDAQPKTVTYVTKVSDSDIVAPGDTVTYTVYYGRPGTNPLTNVIVTDSLPVYTHYVNGSGIPAPDLGWDPDPGPPLRLRWTVSTAGGATTGGPTGMVQFKLTVDWGNGESFEPGSGDVAAPEMARLGNRAHATFTGSNCAPGSAVSSGTSTSVRRFLFWKLADNDIMFSQQIGRPPDEITYEIFIKNMSQTKTWWNVSVWDTVPPEIDSWLPGMGFEDPCVGWTMTPSGCAAAGPGKKLAGTTTLLTWKLDMDPGTTITLRWKGQLKATTPAGATAINRASVQEMGASGIAGGTGNSRTPRSFAHQAPIILPTTYVSYVGFAGADVDAQGNPGFLIAFFPPNKTTQFELRGHHYQGGAFATTGGLSASIGCMVGDCINGFPGDGACATGVIPGNGLSGHAGCKVERTPAVYDPDAYHLDWGATYPLDFVYKVTSNSPVLWQVLTHISHNAQDNLTYAPSTTLSYCGLMHYMWRRAAMDAATGDGDSLVIFNTGTDANGSYSASRETTVHLFEFDYGSLGWDYMGTYELGPESLAVDLGPWASDENPWRTVSSDAQLIVYEGMDTINQTAFGAGGYADNNGGFAPNRNNGNVVSQIGAGAFYFGVIGWAGAWLVNITNTGAASANYQIWTYMPDNPVAVGAIPALCAGTSGTWLPNTVDNVPNGFAVAGNPHIYGGNAFASAGFACYKVELLSGGPIQVQFGANMFQCWSGGAVMHSATGVQIGTQYWLSRFGGLDCGKGSPGTQVVNVFCPKTGQAVTGKGEWGYQATYTTTGPDQCVAFKAITSPAGKENYTFTSASGGVIAQYIQCKITEKGYTAPFLATGTHYVIVAPTVAYSGQSFWITIIVVDTTGGTNDDYCGTTSFTSTDPNAKIESAAMDGFNYTWKSSTGTGCAACGASCDQGVHIFVNVTLNRIGTQTIVAGDIYDGSITGLTTISVVGADVKFSKEPKFSIAASGDTVKFRICWSNYSSASAFTFVITDAVPAGMGFVPEAGVGGFDCGNTDGVVPGVSYSTLAVGVMPGPASFTAGNPVTATRWLRWTIPAAGVQTSGCICYRVSIN